MKKLNLRKLMLGVVLAALLMFGMFGVAFAEEPTWPDLTTGYFYTSGRVWVYEHDSSRASERIGRIELAVLYQTNDLIAEGTAENITGPGAYLAVWYVGSNYTGEPNEGFDMYGLVGNYVSGFWGYSRPFITLVGTSGELSGATLRGRIFSDRSGNVAAIRCQISSMAVGTVGNITDQHTSWSGNFRLRFVPGV